jgi:amidase
VAVAAGLAPLALGTETDGSIVGPAGVCGVVGVKPEAGLLPLDGVAGISPVIDCVGPLASRVRDAAVCLGVLAGQPSLAGVRAPLTECRLGLWLPPEVPDQVARVLADSLSGISLSGITVAEVTVEVPAAAVADGMFALYAEFGGFIGEYLRERTHGAMTSLASLIAADEADGDELALFGQDLFEQVAGLRGASEPAQAARARARDEAREALASVLERAGVQAIVAPSNEPAWQVCYARGDAGRLSTSTLAALAGYPNVSLPAGMAGGLPVGVSVFGPPNVARLLPLALAVERSCGPRPWPSGD